MTSVWTTVDEPVYGVSNSVERRKKFHQSKAKREFGAALQTFVPKKNEQHSIKGSPTQKNTRPSSEIFYQITLPEKIIWGWETNNCRVNALPLQ